MIFYIAKPFSVTTATSVKPARRSTSIAYLLAGRGCRSDIGLQNARYLLDMVVDSDPKGHFIRDTYKTTSGCDLATYTWLPDCGIENAKGCVFLFHGYSYHARFEYLDANEKNERTEYVGSIPASLNELGLIVFGHDHPSHGLSSGPRAYWNRLDELRDAAMEFCGAMLKDERYKLGSKPRFVVAMSMGGTVAVQVARSAPSLFTGYVLLSPAVRTPDDMFGLYGRVLAAFSSVLNVLIPQTKVIRLPPSGDETIRNAVEADELVIKGPVAVRVAKQFLDVYKDIEQNAASIEFPALLVMVGSKDNIVSPSGTHDFVDQVQCPDKEVKVFDNLGHEVIREHGCNEARETLYAWVTKRM
jgi:acylglycerol lipase